MGYSLGDFTSNQDEAIQNTFVRRYEGTYKLRDLRTVFILFLCNVINVFYMRYDELKVTSYEGTKVRR